MTDTHSLPRADALGRVRVLRDSLLDFDVLVDDARCRLSAAVDEYEAAVVRRDDAGRELITAIRAYEGIR